MGFAQCQNDSSFYNSWLIRDSPTWMPSHATHTENRWFSIGDPKLKLIPVCRTISRCKRASNQRGAPVANGQMSHRITNKINIYHITPKYLPPTKMSGIGILRMPQLLHKMEEIGSHQLDQVNEDTVQNQHSSMQFQTRNRGKWKSFSQKFGFHFSFSSAHNSK